MNAISNFPLKQKILGCLVVGFTGTSPSDENVKYTSGLVSKGLGGVLPFSYNIQNAGQFQELMYYFSQQSTLDDLPLLRTLDVEGGLVWRFNKKEGFPIISPDQPYPDLFKDGEGWKWVNAKGITTYFPTPPAILMSQLSDEDAQNIFEKMAIDLYKNGVNFDFAPVVDVGITCPVIGGLGRSYGLAKDVIKYGTMMIEALRSHNILTCLKHFPGHGSATGDSHKGFQDVTQVWDSEELNPFFELASKADSVMTGHLYNEKIDPKWPATLSKSTLDLLRNKGFDGVIISDDLFMGAIRGLNLSLAESAVMALKAGCDMLIFSNNPAATGDPTFKPDPYYLENVIDAIAKAIESGDLPESRLDEAVSRNMQLRRKLVTK